MDLTKKNKRERDEEEGWICRSAREATQATMRGRWTSCPSGTPSVAQRVGHLVSSVDGLVPFTELNEFDEGCIAAKSLLVRGLSAQCSIEQVARARLDGYKSKLCSLVGELSGRDPEKETLAGSLKDANFEIKRLLLELKKEKRDTQGLVDYYNDSEEMMKALRQELELERAAAKAATDEAKTACHLCLGPFAIAWARQGGLVDELIGRFDPLRARRRHFWQKEGQSTEKARLYAQLVKVEATNHEEKPTV
uniref:Uncharacterized protein n=1 Tax=Oryza meridionalis TaxID=40149 RepID=A0A0E0DCN6_9ORYZ